MLQRGGRLHTGCAGAGLACSIPTCGLVAARPQGGARGDTVYIWPNQPLDPRIGALAAQFGALERELFASTWDCEVDETVRIHPDPSPDPAFRFR